MLLTGIIKDPEKNIYVTEIERTIIDCIDRLDLAGGIEELFYNIELIDSVEENKLLSYLSLYDKQVLYQKSGFILSAFKKQLKLSDKFFSECKKMTGKSIRYLTDKYESKTYVPDWKIYVPQFILSLTQ